MTLILSFACPGYTAQVADRLVSVGAKPYDERSNKTLIYFASDGLVSCSYTGLAYLGQDQIPTDAWLMEALTGVPNVGAERWFGTKFTSPAPLGPTLKESLDRLKEKLAAAWAALPASRRAIPFEVAMAGWVGSESESPRPLLCGLSRDPKVGEPETYWKELRTPSASSPGADIGLSFAPSANQHLCHTDLLPRLAPLDQHEKVLDGLVNEVQYVSRRIPGVVGSDCMTVLIPHPRYRELRVRLRSLATSVGTIVDSAGRAVSDKFPVACSPWIVAPGLISEPQTFLGSYWVQAGGFTVYLEAPYNPDSGILFAMSGQRRRRPPMG